MKLPTFNVGGLEIKTRACKYSDYRRIYDITKTTMWHIIKKHVKQDPKIFRDHFNERYQDIVMLLVGRRRISFYRLLEKKDYLQVGKIFLSPAYQNKGIGSVMMNYFETLGYKNIRLEVWENNPALKFYKKHGYRLFSKKNHKLTLEKII